MEPSHSPIQMVVGESGLQMTGTHQCAAEVRIAHDRSFRANQTLEFQGVVTRLHGNESRLRCAVRQQLFQGASGVLGLDRDDDHLQRRDSRDLIRRDGSHFDLMNAASAVNAHSRVIDRVDVFPPPLNQGHITARARHPRADQSADAARAYDSKSHQEAAWLWKYSITAWATVANSASVKDGWLGKLRICSIVASERGKSPG